VVKAAVELLIVKSLVGSAARDLFAFLKFSGEISVKNNSFFGANWITHGLVIFLISTFTFAAAIASDLPPGTDPIVLKSYKHRDLNGNSSGPETTRNAISGRDGTIVNAPGSSARMAKYEARIMTLDFTSSGSVTDRTATNASITVNQSSGSDLTSKVCVMDIGSVTSIGMGALNVGKPGQQAQPVLIRGDVLNICKN
jgi:hypothetical protein